MKVLKEMGRTVINFVGLILGFENTSPQHNVLALYPNLFYLTRVI